MNITLRPSTIVAKRPGPKEMILEFSDVNGLFRSIKVKPTLMQTSLDFLLT